jgi:hypothetical protein
VPRDGKRGGRGCCGERRGVLTQAVREGGWSHRLLAVLDHGTCQSVLTGAVETECVSAHSVRVDERKEKGRREFSGSHDWGAREGAAVMHVTKHPAGPYHDHFEQR